MKDSRADTVAAVVVTHNRRELLGQCLDAVLTQTRPLDAIYVIDNGSTDGTPQLIEQSYRGRVIYQRLPENLGGAGGFHHGMKLAYEAGHDWIWVTDDDGIAWRDALQKLLHALSSEPTAVAAVPSRITPEGEPCPGGQVYDRPSRILIDVWETPGKEKPYDIDFAPFVGLLVRRGAITAVGLPLPELFIYYDDNEYSWRLRSVGRLMVVPACNMIHPYFRGASTDRSFGEYWRYYYGLRNSIYLRGKIPPPHSALYFLYVGFRRACGILAKGDHKVGRLRALARSVFDGFTFRLGRGPDWLRC